MIKIERKNLKPIQTTKRNVPVDQIIAIEGKNPWAEGIDVAGNVLGQAIMRRAQLRQQGEQLAKLEQLSGRQPGAFQSLDPSTAATLTGKYIDMSKPGESLALRKQQMANLEEERKTKFKERRGKEKVDFINKFIADPGVRKIQSSIDAASNVRELVMSGNPIAASAIPTYMARASGEVGNLSEADKRPFGGSQAILKRMEASLTQMATGRLTPDNQKFLIDLADVMENSAVSNLDRRAKEVSTQYGEASEFLDSDEIYKNLRPATPRKLKRIETQSGRVGRFQVEVEP